jgi:hypothetical protein
MGPTFFKHIPKPGRPLSMPGLALGLARLEHAFKNLTVHNGRVDWHGHEPKIILDAVEEQQEAANSTEWAQSIYDATYIRVIGGPVMWSNVQYDSGAAFYDVDYSGLSTNGERWLYVEIDLKNATVTPKFNTDATLPLDEPDADHLIVKWRLSQWKKTETGITRLSTAWPGGCIHLTPVTFGPPVA